MNVEILHRVEGAKKATGCAVIIDVFRACTVEGYLALNGAQRVIPVADMQVAYDMKAADPSVVLIGERHGVILPGFDYGNSPSQIENVDFGGKTVVHTTSAGTQGMENATNADEILLGSLAGADAVARYVKARGFAHVSLVCMGWEALKETEEDNLCARYIKDLLLGASTDYIAEEIEGLKATAGAKFFDPAQHDVFPEKDFFLCTELGRFDFVMKINKTSALPFVEKIRV